MTGRPWLTLSLETDSERIVNAAGGTTAFRASVLRDSAGNLHGPARFPHIGFSVNAAGAELRDFGLLDGGLAGGTLIATGGAGVDLEANADNASVTRHVDFGAAPSAAGGAQGAPGTVVAPKPIAAAASACKASARALSCLLTGKPARVSHGRGVRATLYRSGRRVAAGRVRIAGGKTRLRVGRRVAAGRYTLVLTRGGRRLARQAVVVTSA